MIRSQKVHSGIVSRNGPLPETLLEIMGSALNLQDKKLSSLLKVFIQILI